MTTRKTNPLPGDTIYACQRGFSSVFTRAILRTWTARTEERGTGVQKPLCPSRRHENKWTPRAMQDSNFSDLIDCLRAGDSTAAQRFLDQYGEAVTREVRFVLLDARLRRIVSDSDVCQSVLAQFFFGLWAGKYEFERPADLMGLLRTMVHTRVADLARYWTAGAGTFAKPAFTFGRSLADGTRCHAKPDHGRR